MNSPCFDRFDACLVASLSRGKAKSAALASDHAVAVVDGLTQTPGASPRVVVIGHVSGDAFDRYVPHAVVRENSRRDLLAGQSRAGANLAVAAKIPFDLHVGPQTQGHSHTDHHARR